MITVITIQGNIITIEGATQKDFKLGVKSKMAKIKDYCFNWDQILYVRIIDEEEEKEESPSLPLQIEKARFKS